MEDNENRYDRDELKRFFEMYGRLHHDIEGQWEGLFLARKLLIAANGNIIVESEPGKGSRFILYFQVEERSVNARGLLAE